MVGGEVSEAAMGEPLEGHHLNDAEGRPADVVANHVQVGQLTNCLNKNEDLEYA